MACYVRSISLTHALEGGFDEYWLFFPAFRLVGWTVKGLVEWLDRLLLWYLGSGFGLVCVCVCVCVCDCLGVFFSLAFNDH